MGMVRAGVKGRFPQDVDSETHSHARSIGGSILEISIGRRVKKGLNRVRS